MEEAEESLPVEPQLEIQNMFEEPNNTSTINMQESPSFKNEQNHSNYNSQEQPNLGHTSFNSNHPSSQQLHQEQQR